jgi:hypothetical protein
MTKYILCLQRQDEIIIETLSGGLESLGTSSRLVCKILYSGDD